MEKRAEIDKKQLDNDMMRLEIIKELSMQLENSDFSKEEIHDIVHECMVNLSLLNSHIDNERIIRIDEVDNY